MKKHLIVGVKPSETKEKNIIASSIEEAINKFKKKYPKYIPDWVDDKSILGYCEYSGKPIFEGDEYYSDSDGIMWLTEEEKGCNDDLLDKSK